MKKKHVAAIALYSCAVAIILSWAALCSFDEFTKIGSKGIPKSTVATLPEAIQPFYKGFPNLSSLLCYILLTLTAFLSINEKKPLLRIINVTSFVLVFMLLFLLS